MSRTTLLRGASAGALLLAYLTPSFAQTALPPIEVRTTSRRVASPSRPTPQPVREVPSPVAPVAPAAAPTAQTANIVVERQELELLIPPVADTSQLLREAPGVSMYEAGGVSRLPAIHGMADDRLNILLGGVSVTSACANHMNPPLSYIDPNNVEKIEVYSGVMRVSKGGDSIGGTIVVEPKQPVFASQAPPAPVAARPFPAPFFPAQGLRFGAKGEVLVTGQVSGFFRGNNTGIGTSGTVNVATDHWSLLYNGAWSRATDYHAGANGPKVLSTGFISEQHSATLAYQNDGHFLSIRGAIENMPYQGFPNQRMDMIKNKGYTVEGKYLGDYAFGKVEARAFWHHVIHNMGFLYDKQPANMPMATIGADFGYSLKTEIPFTQISGHDLLRLGGEFHGGRLNDWWEPVAGGMMAPNAYWNISAGRRDRLGHYAEWEAQWTPKWTTLLGVRNDTVWMDAGMVAPYDWRNPVPMGSMCMMGMCMPMMMANPDAIAAASFNLRNRARTDVNFDMTASAKYQHDEAASIEAGYSRKTRSPNMYERYAWGVGAMAMSMVNWFGDANGYTGNVDLKPEVAHTFGVTGLWRDPAGKFEARLNPYYSYVENFIDADRIGNTGGVPYVFQLLQFRNHKAELYGVDFSGRMQVYEDAPAGRFTASAKVNYVYGRNLDTGRVRDCAFYNTSCYTLVNLFARGSDGLYNIMPLNAHVGLEHRLGGWFNVLEVQLVDSKTHVSTQRNEFKTPNYALLNLRTGYEWDNVRIDLGVENVTDMHYYPALGGFYFSQFKTSKYASPLPGMGRNFFAGLTVKF